MRGAIRAFGADVRAGTYPDTAHSFAGTHCRTYSSICARNAASGVRALVTIVQQHVDTGLGELGGDALTGG